MVVDTEALRNPADASAAVEHRAAEASDDLVDRDHKRVRNANVDDKTTEGSESFSPRPLLLVGLGESQNSHRRNSESR